MCLRHQKYGFRLLFRLHFEDGPPSSYSSPALAVTIEMPILAHRHTHTFILHTYNIVSLQEQEFVGVASASL